MNWPDNDPEDEQTRRERRGSPRSALLLKGNLYQRGCVVDCVVSNLSIGGAKLLLAGSADDRLPDPVAGSIVTLTVARFGDLPARLVWSQRTAIGIGFLQSSDEVAVLLSPYLNSSQTA